MTLTAHQRARAVERARAVAGAVSFDAFAIVEDWCPDVAANLPIIARIAEDTGALRLHVLIRDDTHRDIADAYPYPRPRGSGTRRNRRRMSRPHLTVYRRSATHR